jgi:hypothetical protein
MMNEREDRGRERWSPHGRRGAAGTMGNDAILVGGWLSHPAHATREVDLYTAYRALARENMAERLFDADTDDLAFSLKTHPDIEHLAGVRITFNDRGTTRTLGEGDEPPPDRRHVGQLSAELTLRKGNDPPRTMRVPADIGFIRDDDDTWKHLVLGRSSGITAAKAADTVMELFGATLHLEAAANCEEEPERLRDTIEEEAVRILEGDDAAALRRIHNIARRNIGPAIPAGRGARIEIDTDGRIRAGFR